jgi:hypothetical protein
MASVVGIPVVKQQCGNRGIKRLLRYQQARVRWAWYACQLCSSGRYDSRHDLGQTRLATARSCMVLQAAAQGCQTVWMCKLKRPCILPVSTGACTPHQ